MQIVVVVGNAELEQAEFCSKSAKAKGFKDFFMLHLVTSIEIPKPCDTGRLPDLY